MATFTVTSCDYYLIRWLLGLPSNTPPQVEASPISVRCLLCFGRARALVSTSAVCSGSRQLSIVTRSCLINSLTQCHRIAMCLLRLWNCWFLAIEIELSLSPLMSVGCSCGNPSSSKRLRNQQASRAASDKATYSVLMRGLSSFAFWISRWLLPLLLKIHNLMLIYGHHG